MKNKTNSKNKLSRRQFMGASVVLSGGLIAASQSVFGAPSILKYYGQPNSLIKGVQIGLITYSFRSLPDQSAEATLKYIVDSGISAIELMGGPAESFAGMPASPVDRRAMWQLSRKASSEKGLTKKEKKELESMKEQLEEYNKEIVSWRTTASMDKFTELKKMYADAGISIYAFKPSTFSKRNTDAEIEYGVRAASALGASHVTLEFPGDLEQTKRLSTIAGKHNIRVAYHGHEQQTPILWDEALAQSEYNAMNLDAGHYVAAGNPSPVELIKTKHDRIASMHIKDRQNKEHGKANLPFGQGDTPIVELLQTMRDNKYTFPATIELEYKVPEDSDPVTEVTNCLDYCRKALEG